MDEPTDPVIIGQEDAGRPAFGDVLLRPLSRPLSKLCLGNILFTPALVLLYGQLDRDPVQEFLMHNHHIPDEDLPYAIDCPQLLFANLESTQFDFARPIDWTRRLYVVSNVGWPAVREFIGGMAMIDRKQRFFARVMLHLLRIADPTALASDKLLTEMPIANITIFGVAGMRRTMYMHPAVDPPQTLPFPAAHEPPDPAVVQEGRRLLSM